MAKRATAPCPGGNVHSARRGGFFPLTPALPMNRTRKLLEMNECSKTGSWAQGAIKVRGDLSLRERARVRGNGESYHPSYRLTHGNVVLSRSPGGAGGLQNDCMSPGENIFVHGIGAVSPAGWGMLPLREALAKGEPLQVNELARPGWTRSLRVRPVPPPSPRPDFLTHARLRRTSPITQYAVAAALEALGNDAARVSGGSLRLGIIFCVMTGCVNYSRRFYDETLKDPATASPLVFPETVFNAPASHLAALLGTTA